MEDNRRKKICALLRNVVKNVIYRETKRAESELSSKNHSSVIIAQTRLYQSPKCLIGGTAESLRTRSADLPALNVHELINANVVDSQGHVVNSHYSAIADSYVHGGVQPSPLIFKWKLRKHSHLQFDDLAVLGSEVSSQNYYHWMIEALPRLELIRRSGTQVSKYLIHCSLPFQREMLKLAGIRENEIVPLEKNKVYSAKRLILPSLLNNNYMERKNGYTHYLARYFHPWICAFYDSIAENAKAHITKAKGPARIFVSRQDAKVRRVSNEMEVIRKLEKLSFYTCHLEGMSIVDQIQTFRDAEVVVAPHGAGLANIVFGRRNLVVFEFFCRDFVPNFYWLLANEMGQKYGCLLCEPENENTGADPSLANYRVSIDGLFKGLHELIGL